MLSSAVLRRVAPLGVVLVLAACGSSSKDEGSTNPGTTTQPAATTDATGCTTVTAPPTKARKVAKPTAKLDAAKTYTVTMRTNCGSFTIKLATKSSPATTASFVNLVRKGFFDRTVFHRIVPGFIIQGGDPTASGLGGPGYTTIDKPPASTRYTLGLVAMAKAASDPPGSSGSQFFVVTAQDAQLPPEYAVLGTVSSGLPVVEKIGRLGDPSTEQPTETVEIQKATVAES
jgi:peptidyl-prolyl cis-trans isomerase B (cyclophilin B)